MIDVGNIYFTDVFLGGRFLRYGSQVMKFYSHSHSERRDLPNPMCTVFPTITRYARNGWYIFTTEYEMITSSIALLFYGELI